VIALRLSMFVVGVVAATLRQYGTEISTADEPYPSFAERQLHHAINLARLGEPDEKKKKKKKKIRFVLELF
jgi:uncharacterized protein YaeQ